MNEGDLTVDGAKSKDESAREEKRFKKKLHA